MLKIESVLREYLALKSELELKEMELKEIYKNGLIGKSVSILEYSSPTGTVGGLERIVVSKEQRIKHLKYEIGALKRKIALIDAALKDIEKDRYFDIIGLFYWHNLSIGEIAARLNCHRSTVERNKERLLFCLSRNLIN